MKLWLEAQQSLMIRTLGLFLQNSNHHSCENVLVWFVKATKDCIFSIIFSSFDKCAVIIISAQFITTFFLSIYLVNVTFCLLVFLLNSMPSNGSASFFFFFLNLWKEANLHIQLSGFRTVGEWLKVAAAAVSPIEIINGHILHAWVNGLISKGVALFEMPPLTTEA